MSKGSLIIKRSVFLALIILNTIVNIDRSFLLCFPRCLASAFCLLLRLCDQSFNGPFEFGCL